MQEEIEEDLSKEVTDGFDETDDLNESDGELVSVYTEVPPEAVERLIHGDFEPESPIRHHPNRWFAEWALDQFEPEELKERGVAREQTIFASPIPHQGAKPISGRVLMVLDVDPDMVYVAEGEYVTEIISGGLQRVMLLRDTVGFPVGGMTKKEFDEIFKDVPKEVRERLLDMVKGPAEWYWASVIPYEEYRASDEKYYEPEILMVKGTGIHNMRVGEGGESNSSLEV